MQTFLNKLAQLDSIEDVILLSNNGEVLFAKSAEGAATGEEKAGHWSEVIAGLAGAPSAEFFFEQGCFHVHNIDIGYLIVGMRNVRALDRVRVACTQLRSKIADSAVRKKVLLKMLAEIDETLKPHLVRALFGISEGIDREMAGQLIDLLRQLEGSAREKEGLLVALCEALGHCPSAQAINALNEFLEKGKGTLPREVEKAARVSLQQLMLDLPQPVAEVDKEQKDHLAPRGAANHSAGTSNSPSPAAGQQIEELLRLGKKSEAIDRIMGAIEIAAKNRQFDQAEKLRERLIEIDSMALREIIRAAEIIEQAKLVSVSRDFQTTWQDLALVLSNEEFSALYHAMSPRLFARDEMVARQGELCSQLFFVNSGRVQLYAAGPDFDIPLKIAEAGEIMGIANFFELSVWTVNARSLGAEIYVLTRAKLQGQKELYPALESKLQDFCQRLPSINALFSKTGRSRRKFERKKTSGTASIALLDDQGKETGLGAKGAVLDVSKGGLSFSLRFSKRKNAAALLGKKIRVDVRPANGNASVICNGKVVAVRCCDFIGSDYSLHVEFRQELDSALLQQLTGKGK